MTPLEQHLITTWQQIYQVLIKCYWNAVNNCVDFVSLLVKCKSNEITKHAVPREIIQTLIIILVPILLRSH